MACLRARVFSRRCSSAASSASMSVSTAAMAVCSSLGGGQPDLICYKLSLSDFEEGAAATEADESLFLRRKQVIEKFHVRCRKRYEVLEALIGRERYCVDGALTDCGPRCHDD